MKIKLLQTVRRFVMRNSFFGKWAPPDFFRGLPRKKSGRAFRCNLFTAAGGKKDFRCNPWRPRGFLLLIMTAALCATPVFSKDRVVDNAGLLAAAEKAGLEESLETLAAAHNFELVIVTEKSTGGAGAMAYADDFFDKNGYGIGPERDGCLFLQVTGSRDYWFSTSGRGIEILNADAFDKLENDVVPFLADDDAAGACHAFISDWKDFLALAAAGKSYNPFRAFLDEWHLALTAGAWLLALLLAFVIVASWKAQLNTALPQTQAAAYMVSGSLAFTDKRDSFLYSTVTKTRRETRQAASRGGGGTHMSSSGRRHGGGGGRY